MSELSLVLDESGSDNLRDIYCILALVVHDQSENLGEGIERYQEALRQQGLPDIPLHATPLLNGHDAYEGMTAPRKTAALLLPRLLPPPPITYGLVVLKTREHASLDNVSAVMHRRIVDFLFDTLAYLQGFERVKICYNNGQQSIADALFKNAVTYRLATASGYRLSRAADYICTAEFTALKYQGRRPQQPTRSSSTAGCSSKKAYSKKCGPSGCNALAQIRNDSYQVRTRARNL